MNSVSIVIRCKNEEEMIGKTLDQIFRQRSDVPFDVVVVDSGSTDSTLDIVSKYDVKLLQIPPEEFTFGYALNYGLEHASGSILCNLSAHSVPVNESWLSSLVGPILEGSADATFGRQTAYRGVNIWEEVSLEKHFPEHGEIKGRLPFSNANCAFTSEMWKRKKFDEEASSWEDYLWYLLLKDEYRFKYCPGAAVYHSHPFSMKSLAKRAYNDGRAFKMIRNKYGIDLLGGVCPSFITKIKTAWNDIVYHARLFRKAGYSRYIYQIPFVRLYAFKAYWNGYNSMD